MHEHPANVVIPLTDAVVRFTLPDGTTQEPNKTPGGEEGQGEGEPISGTTIMARLTTSARRLRHDQTDAERRAVAPSSVAGNAEGPRWQHPIPPFMTAVCCVERRLVVELDGGQPAEMPEDDRRRTQFLQSQGYQVLCFWDT